jgi:glycosyltransferase involved in cell wall biosynthesis
MKKQLTVWLLQTGEPLHCDAGQPRPMRAMNLANALVDAGHKVVLWSAAFYHQEKRHRLHGEKQLRIGSQLEIRLISSPGYVRNIGLGRLWDHAVLGYRLKQLLRDEIIVPDVAFVGYPPIEAAAVMTRWLATRGVPSLLDVKDQWPGIFIDVLPAPLKLVGRVALAPYFHYGRRALRDATALSAMADGFLQWAAGFAGRAVSDLDRVVPLTTPIGRTTENELQEAGTWWDQQGVYNDGRQRICFVGSHSKVFDMEPVIQAAKLMADRGNTCQCVLCGDGENSAAWRKKMADLPNVYFPGWIDRVKIEALALRSSAALAPYCNSDDFVLSIPNKVIDSLALGLPVLSPLSGEVKRLISDFDVGISYGPVAEKSLESCIEDLAVMPDLRKKLSDNAKKLFRQRFSFEMVYGGLVSHLENLARLKRGINGARQTD